MQYNKCHFINLSNVIWRWRGVESRLGKVNTREMEGWRVFVNISWTTFNSMCLFNSCKIATISYLFLQKLHCLTYVTAHTNLFGIAWNLTTLVIHYLWKNISQILTKKIKTKPKLTFETEPIGKSRFLAVCVREYKMIKIILRWIQLDFAWQNHSQKKRLSD